MTVTYTLYDGIYDILDKSKVCAMNFVQIGFVSIIKDYLND